MTSPPGDATAPAGWYPEEATGFLRYWDGAVWTEQRRIDRDVEPPLPAMPAAESGGVSAQHPPTATRSAPTITHRRRARSPVRTVVGLLCGALLVFGYIHISSDEFKLKCEIHKTAQSFGQRDDVGFPDSLLCDAFYH